MASGRWIVFVVVIRCALGAGADGEADPGYRDCVKECERTGYVGENLFQHCQFLSDDVAGRPWYMQEPLYLRWREWNCRKDCQYYCMMETEKNRGSFGLVPVKYHGKWPFKRVFVLEEPVSAAVSAINLILHFNGWLSFFVLVHYKIPLKPQSRKPYYEYTGLLHIYGVLAMNAMLWSAIYHIQDFDIVKKIDYSATAAVLGYSLILSIVRTFSLRDAASRVMVAAPLLSFIVTHIFYMNLYELDIGLNKKVTVGMGVTQLLVWAGWATFTGHPSKFNIGLSVVGAGLIMFLELYDFPPYKGYVDSHGLSHIIAIIVTFLWWRFFKDDAVFRSAALIKKFK